MVRSPGVVQSIEAIVAHVWGDADVTVARKRTMAVLVASLRAKFGAHGLGANAIVTAQGLGYYYRPPTRPAPARRIGYGHAERLLNLPDPG